MRSTNRGRLTSAVTGGRAAHVVMRLGVAIEVVTGAHLAHDPGRGDPRARRRGWWLNVNHCLGVGGALVGLGIAGASAMGWYAPTRGTDAMIFTLTTVTATPTSNVHVACSAISPSICRTHASENWDPS